MPSRIIWDLDNAPFRRACQKFPITVKGSSSTLYDSRDINAPEHIDGAKDQKVSYNARTIEVSQPTYDI